MDKQLTIRRPVPQKHHGLSTVSKIFFGMDIFQVVVVVVFQSIMIGCGNFNAYNKPENPGMGPGRRIYMFVYMGVIVYTCFLCLFAVKKQNFLEILAFLLQNFGFVAYGLIQVYHVGYKKLPLREGNVTMEHNPLLRNIALSNSLTLFILNGVFIFLSWKLYTEFGWKIYKRVRFNLSLRSIYHFYQLLSCLLKMAIMYWWMYAICNSFVLLRDYQSVMYYINLAFVPTSILYACLGYFATQREIKTLMTIFILWTLGLIGYFLYKLYGFLTDSCNGCQEFHKTGKDIHDEAMLHFIYLGTLNLLLLIAILGVSCKVFSNFGRGLAQHFKPDLDSRRPRAGTDLYLRRISHYFEESVVSATSCDSDELQESMKLGYQGVLVTSGVPLLTNSNRVLASSMPNLFEPEPRAFTFPGVKERNEAPVSTLNSVRCQLGVIDEDDDLKKVEVGTITPRKTSKPLKQNDAKGTRNKKNEIEKNGINERSASCPLKQLTVSGSSKDSRSRVGIDDVGDDDVFIDRSDGEQASRDSGFMDSLPKSQNDAQTKLKTRKKTIISSKDTSNGVQMNGREEKVDDKRRTNGVKAQISLFNGEIS